MTQHILRSAAIAAFICCASPLALAGEAEDKVIDKVVEAYGGKKFENMKSISIYSDLRFGWVGQGYTPGYVELPQMVKDLKIDFENQRGSEESWGGPNNNYNTRSFSTEGGMGEINYLTKTYSIDEEGTFHGRFSGEIRASDTLLAYELMTRRDNTALKEMDQYQGVPHAVLTLSIPDWTPMDIWVNQETGHITKMQRASGFGALRYQFADFKKTNGITYGSDFDFYAGEFFSEYAKERSIKVNSVRESTFAVDRGFELESAKVDMSEMAVDAVGDNIHHVGANFAFTSFIDAGDHVVAVGGYRGLEDRIEAYKIEHGADAKPVRHMVVTHHHLDHLGGMEDAKEAGVIFHVTPMAKDSFEEAAGGDVPDHRIKLINGSQTLGPVQIYDIATSHVGSYALVYVPESKTIIQVDHYNGEFVDGPSLANRNSVSLKREIDRLGLDVESVLSLHGRKAESWSDFSKAVAAFNPDPCPTGRAICS